MASDPESVKVGKHVAELSQADRMRTVPDISEMKIEVEVDTVFKTTTFIWPGAERPLVLGQQTGNFLHTLVEKGASETESLGIFKPGILSRLRLELRNAGIPFSVQATSSHSARLAPMPSFVLPGHEGVRFDGATRAIYRGGARIGFRDDFAYLALDALLSNGNSRTPKELANAIAPDHADGSGISQLRAWACDIPRTLHNADIRAKVAFEQQVVVITVQPPSNHSLALTLA